MSKQSATQSNLEAMSYGFSAQQTEQLNLIKRAFNNFTGENFTLAQFIDFMIKDAIQAELNACNASIAIMQGMPRFANQQIKPVQTIQPVH